MVRNSFENQTEVEILSLRRMCVRADMESKVCFDQDYDPTSAYFFYTFIRTLMEFNSSLWKMCKILSISSISAPFPYYASASTLLPEMSISKNTEPQ